MRLNLPVPKGILRKGVKTRLVYSQEQRERLNCDKFGYILEPLAETVPTDKEHTVLDGENISTTVQQYEI